MTTSRSARTATTILFDGADYERLSYAKRKLVAAENEAAARGSDRDAPSSARGGDLDPVTEAEFAYNTLLEEARERATEVRIRALTRKQWRTLRAEHGPREGNAVDQVLGYNGDDLPDAAVRACMTAPEFPSSIDRDAWIDDLTDGELETLFGMAQALNEGAPADPKDFRTDGS